MSKELDIKVAEQVMRYVKTPNPLIYKDPDNLFYCIVIDVEYTPRCPYKRFMPSIDILAAWTVMEKTNLLESYSLEKDGDDYVFGHNGEYGFDEWTEFVRTPIAPEAICLAALKVVSYED